jgi:hypothetical protein
VELKGEHAPTRDVVFRAVIYDNDPDKSTLKSALSYRFLWLPHPESLKDTNEILQLKGAPLCPEEMR